MTPTPENPFPLVTSWVVRVLALMVMLGWIAGRIWVLSCRTARHVEKFLIYIWRYI